MKIGVLGSGPVGKELSKGLLKLRHEVMVGTRDQAKLADWAVEMGEKASVGSFSDAAKFGEIIFIATSWEGTESALKMAGPDNFREKIVVDVTNPLDTSHGAPPRPAIQYPVSASEKIQKWLPGAKVVKALNTVPAHVQVHPKQIGEADLFIAGDKEAKEFVKAIADEWGWHGVVDMGDLSAAYWIEMLAMLVINYGFKYNDWNFAIRFLRKK